MLVAERLSKSFGKRVVLDQVSTTLEPGAANIVIGPSGSGKSTLIRCLALLETPDSGTIQVDDLYYRFPAESRQPQPPWPKLTVVLPPPVNLGT